MNDTLLENLVELDYQKRVRKNSVIYVFNTKFYTKMLEEDGVKKVTNWTTKWNLDVFCKTMLLIPIHSEFHLSFCIVCYAGNIYSSDFVEEVSCFECLS